MIHSATATLISHAAAMVPVLLDGVKGPTKTSHPTWVKNCVPAPMPMA